MSKKTFKATFRVTTWFETDIIATNIHEARAEAASQAMKHRETMRRECNDHDLDIAVATVDATGGARGLDHDA